ncbi:MAG: alpha/beta hydrolase, partial [Myxococcota bacterium]
MRRTGTWNAEDGTALWFGLDGVQGPTVVLCDGLGCDGYAWPYIIDRLEGRFSLVRWHYRGHGNSEEPADLNTGLGVERFAHDLHGILNHAAALDEEGTPTPSRPVILVGHSLGCQVALEYAHHYPDEIAALVMLCGASGRVLDTFRDTDRFRNVLRPLLAAVDKAPLLVNTLWRGVLSSPLGWVASRGEVNLKRLRRRDFMPYLQHMGKVRPEVFLRTLADAAEHDASPLLPTIAAPTLVVAGALDNFTPVHRSQELAEQIPNSTLLILEEGTHTAPLEHPE